MIGVSEAMTWRLSVIELTSALRSVGITAPLIVRDLLHLPTGDLPLALAAGVLNDDWTAPIVGNDR